MYSFKNIEFIINFSWTDHITDLHIYEQVKNNCQLARISIVHEWFIIRFSIVIVKHPIQNILCCPMFYLIVGMFLNFFQRNSNRFIIFVIFLDESVSSKDYCIQKYILEDCLANYMFQHFPWNNIFFFPVRWSI